MHESQQRKWTFCSFDKIRKIEKERRCWVGLWGGEVGVRNAPCWHFSQTPRAPGATLSMTDVLSMVSSSIYYSQPCEKYWWRDQRRVTYDISRSNRMLFMCKKKKKKESLITAAADGRRSEGGAAKLAKAFGGTRLWFDLIQRQYGFNTLIVIDV